MAQQLSAEKRLERCVVKLMRNKNYAYLSGILMLGNKYVNDTGGPDKNPMAKGTASTNGKDEWYARKFVDSQNDKQLMFVVVHEAMHKMYRHLSIWRHLFRQNPNLANAATDFVINNKLVKDTDLELPQIGGKPIGLVDHKYDEMDTGEIFRELMKQQKCGGGGKGKGQKGGQPGKGGKGDEQGDGDGDLESQQFDGHDWEGNQSMNEEEQKELERQIDQALRQGAILAGKMGANVDRDVGELMKPKQNWKELLKDFVKSMCKKMEESSWQRPNRRYVGQDIYMPSWTGHSVGRILCAIDVSGSVSQELATQFVSECFAIAKEVNPEILDIVYWDACVNKHEMYRQGDNQAEEFITNTRPVGGGGTSPSCVPPYIKENKIENVMCIIVLTDGYVGGDWGELKEKWPAPVLWIIEGSGDMPNVGKAVHVAVGEQ